MHVTEWDLRRISSFASAAGTRVLVCKNPRVIEGLAERGLDGWAAVCTFGEPNLVVDKVLVCLAGRYGPHHHGDFDWPVLATILDGLTAPQWLGPDRRKLLPLGAQDTIEVLGIADREPSGGVADIAMGRRDLLCAPFVGLDHAGLHSLGHEMCKGGAMRMALVDFQAATRPVCCCSAEGVPRPLTGCQSLVASGRMNGRSGQGPAAPRTAAALLRTVLEIVPVSDQAELGRLSTEGRIFRGAAGSSPTSGTCVPCSGAI